MKLLELKNREFLGPTNLLFKQKNEAFINDYFQIR